MSQETDQQQVCQLPKFTPKKRGKVLVAVVILLVVFSLLFSTVKWVSSDNPVFVFHYAALRILTTSMQDTIPQGSLIIIKSTEGKDLRPGDDITYFADPHTTITHRIVAIYPDYENGMIGFQTKGTNNAVPDPSIVLETNVAGRVVWHIPTLGALLTFLF